MSTATAQEMNTSLYNNYRSDTWREKTAAAQVKYIGDRMREASFVERIQPPMPVDRSELQVSLTQETMVKIVFMQQESHAVTMANNNTPEMRVIKALRFPVSFFKISSRRYEYSDEDMLVYPWNIVEHTTQQMLKDMAELQDHYSLTQYELAVQAQQKHANSVAFSADFGLTTAMTAYNANLRTAVSRGVIKSDDALTGDTATTTTEGAQSTAMFPVQKNDFIRLGKLFSGRGSRGSRMECKTILISNYDKDDIANWSASEVGFNQVENTTIHGWKHNTLFGRTLISTIKTDMLRPGNIYGFDSSERIGGFLTYGKVQTFMDRQQNMASVQSWRRLAIYIGNISAVRKLELYCGTTATISGTSTSGVQTDFSPVAEEQLGEKNHYVDLGQYFPQLTAY
jgi:hypothetical protein